MLHEVAFGGLLLPPLLPLLLVTLMLFWLLHWQMEKRDLYRYFWHPALAGCALFVILTALVLALSLAF